MLVPFLALWISWLLAKKAGIQAEEGPSFRYRADYDGGRVRRISLVRRHTLLNSLEQCLHPNPIDLVHILALQAPGRIGAASPQLRLRCYLVVAPCQELP